MIKVIVGTNVERKTVLVGETATLRSVLESEGIDYTMGTMHLDGASLAAGDLDKTFADFGIVDTCYLLRVVKADNAV